jgi:DedD protein
VERLVKERLVGAAVLMAAAIILIPEMLSGPDRTSRAEPAAAQTRSDAPIKTYTIDLSQSTVHQPTPAVVDNRVPPPEEPAAESPAEAQPAPAAQAKPEEPQQSAAGTAQPQPVVEQPTVDAPPAREPQRPLASGGDAPTSARWAVQVGTFKSEANAQRLVKQLRDQGQSAFLMPVKSGGGTMYRVRIGPMADRASAEAVLRAVKSQGAKIVPHQ